MANQKRRKYKNSLQQQVAKSMKKCSRGSEDVFKTAVRKHAEVAVSEPKKQD